MKQTLPLSKLRVRGSVHVHFTKRNVLQNGSLYSPEGKCLGKFPRACLKALVFAIICDAQIASSLFDRYKGIYHSLKHNSSSAIYINRLVMTETKLLKTLNQLNQLNHCLKKIKDHRLSPPAGQNSLNAVKLSPNMYNTIFFMKV